MRRSGSLRVDVPIHVDDDIRPTTPATTPAINILSSYKPLQPSLTLLFSLVPRRDMFCLFLPAVLVSLISGGVAPFMTIAVGQVFDAFAAFPLSNPTQEDKDKLMRSVGISALTLLVLAVVALVLSSITSSLWIATGERNLRALRRRVYHVISNKEMVWFDKKLGSDDSMKATDGEDGPIGAGGMMAQFVKYAYFLFEFSLRVSNIRVGILKMSAPRPPLLLG
jgi:ATP-binding cassette subfamily B (MDR/TAP) protein 1